MCGIAGTRHFPPERNHLARRPPPTAVVGEARLLGRGVALRIDAPDLLALRADLAGRFDPWLTSQDRGKREPHVTVQNKVAPEQARGLHAVLSGHPPEPTAVVALGLWRYRGGPWDPVATYPFTP
ncbi:2'-5' RNA ligase family protein [Pseudonocardia sp. RS010]|uniref:2'-5' RNA ligase family protein n=1 Tax=Pseudonocardia sp. RS010 TaxID=3385979 RepID=UPI0039A1FBFA